MPQPSKQVSLHPLSFEDALRGAMAVDPTKIKKASKKKPAKKKPAKKAKRKGPL